MVRKYDKQLNTLAIENAKLNQLNQELIANQQRDHASPYLPFIPPIDTNVETDTDPKPGDQYWFEEDDGQKGFGWLAKQLSINPQVALAKNDKFRIPIGTPPPNDRMYGIPTLPNGHPMYNKWSNRMQINPQQIAELYLPGERGSTPGGLGNMNKDSLERWIKENGITGAGADKIRNKWKGLQGDINLPLASIPESYRRENVGGTLMDVMLPLLIQNYGKGPDGKYKDPDKLIEMMGKLKGV